MPDRCIAFGASDAPTPLQKLFLLRPPSGDKVVERVWCVEQAVETGAPRTGRVALQSLATRCLTLPSCALHHAARQKGYNDMWNRVLWMSFLALFATPHIQSDSREPDNSDYYFYSNEQKEFLSVLKDIEKLVKESGNQDLKDSVDIVKDETQKPTWNKKLMTMGLNAIKGVANGFVVKGLMALVEKAIVILGAC